MHSLLTYPHRTFRCIKFCNDPKLLDKFRESAKLLDMVQKGLSDYLETKRAGFSRFYFLSNDELLEILSQTKVGILRRFGKLGRATTKNGNLAGVSLSYNGLHKHKIPQ